MFRYVPDMKHRTWGASVVAIMVVCAVTAGVADAASKKLSVKGRVTGSEGQTIAVLMVGNDGTSVRTPVAPDGTFEVKVPSRVVSKMATGKSGKGPTLHLVKNGKYSGPVMLGSKGAKGYTRLSAKKTGTLTLGLIALQTNYAVARAKASLVDTSRTIRLKGGKPVSTGSVREAAVFGPVHSFDVVVADTTVIGADSDRDGLPNFADPDLNGDGVLDAAQPEPGSEAAKSSSEVMATARPTGRFGFQKIIEQPSVVEVNSNANPGVTEAQLLSYLTYNMSIEMGVGLSAAEMNTTTVLVDCRKLSYCSVGSTSMIRGAPGESIDGQELAVLQNPDGYIVMPQRLNENTKLVRFYPGASSATEAALSGDVFELILQKDGATTFSEAHVVTSSFVTPMAVTSFNGNATKLLAHQEGGLVLGTDRKASVTFYRPQSFASGSTSSLVDRGGMRYDVSFWPQDGSNTMYRCPSVSFSGLTSTLGLLAQNPEPGFFDRDQVPAANGTQLGFSVDASQCRNNPQGNSSSDRAPTFTSGAKWRLELQATDSDSNKARVGVEFSIG